MKINKVVESAGIQIFFTVYDKSQVSPKNFKNHLKILDTDEIYKEYTDRSQLESWILEQYKQFITEANLVGNVYVVLHLSDGSFMPDYTRYNLPAAVTPEHITSIIDKHFDLVDAPR